MQADKKDLLAGAIFCAFGLFFALTAYLKLRLGNALNMGPGYFPALLGGILCLIGAIMMGASIGRQTGTLQPLAWRAIFFISASIVIFAVTVDRFGFLPATAMAVLISAFASRTMTWTFATALTAVLTAFCVGVFYYGLGLPLALFNM